MENKNKDSWEGINHFMLIIVLVGIVLCMTNLKCKASVNQDSVYKYAIEIGIKYPEVCAAQAVHETGNFKSYGCRYRHNLFGFGGYGSYKEFNNWKQSVEYYKQWQDKKLIRRCSSYECWFKYISHHYAADKHYGKKLKGVLSRCLFRFTYDNIETINSIIINHL